MYTGLVGTGRVLSVESDDQGARVRIGVEFAGEIGEGDSVAVDGVCLTATSIGDRSFCASVTRETWRRTAGFAEPGSICNVELPLRAGDRLGGHLVQGHVDGVGAVVAVEEDGFARRVRVEPEEKGLLRYVVEKGSVAVHGVSLTVCAVDELGFEVSLIPETLQRTTFGSATIGSAVNLEVDLLAKHLEKLATPAIR